MLVRAFRLSDKITNALLRCLIWLIDGLARQIYATRVALVGFLSATWFMLTQTMRTGRVAYAATAERRRAIMARRVEEQTTRKVVREDPLRSQNRALSLFTVVLLLALIGLVLWATSNAGTGRVSPPRTAAGALPIIPTQPTNTPLPPTPTIPPSPTTAPDPLRATGSIVYSVRENGRENLWARGLGQTTDAIRLTNNPDDRDAVWSPDGTRIAFASRRGGNWDLYVLDMTTGAATQLTRSLAFEAGPSWSPDGQFLAYEAYEANNLDVYLVQADGNGQPQRLTYNPAPDFSPAWNPGGAPVPGRQIAYVSLRDGNAEIYVISLDQPYEDQALRFTNSPQVDEGYPTWSPDGATLAFSALTNGLDFVYTKPLARPDAAPTTVGLGREPTWSPDGQSLLFVLDIGGGSTLVGGLANGSGRTATAISVSGRVRRPHWTRAALPDTLIATGGAPSATSGDLFTESVAAPRPEPPPYQFRTLTGVEAPLPVLSDRVDDSFVALREAVLRQSGLDFLGRLQDAAWSLDRLPEAGQSKQSWYYAGRAFAFDRNLVFNQPVAPVEIVREDINGSTFWRVYIRIDERAQGGQLGEPLRRLPWDFASRGIGDPQIFEQGGRYKSAVPPGYYLDFTLLAEDYGWQRQAASSDWRTNFPGIRYWEFVKAQGLGWVEAMLELYTQPQIDSFLFNTPQPPTLTPLPTEQIPSGPRTPTPVPPDLGGS